MAILRWAFTKLAACHAFSAADIAVSDAFRADSAADRSGEADLESSSILEWLRR